MCLCVSCPYAFKKCSSAWGNHFDELLGSESPDGEASHCSHSACPINLDPGHLPGQQPCSLLLLRVFKIQVG